MTDLAPPAAIRSLLVRALFDYWQSKRGQRIAPAWREIDPGEIPRLLPHLCVSEVLTDPFDLRFRIVGTFVADAAGKDFTGLTFSSMRITTGRALWQQHYLRVVEGRRPAYGRYRAEIGPDIVYYADHGAFPISNDGIAVQRIIEIEDWSEVRGASPGRMDLPIWQFELL
jgi:hypothetical protein